MIKFGTDGWRAVMCEEFTFPNVRLVVQGICNYLKSENVNPAKGIFIGYDTRAFSEKFAQTAAQVLYANGFSAILPRRDCPTPVTAFTIGQNSALGALMFTASHNPPEYNGIKFIPQNMSPAMPEVTDKIEEEIKKIISEKREIKTGNFKNGILEKKISYMDPMPKYVKRIRSLLDYKKIKTANLKIVYDALYGTGRDYVEQVLGDMCRITPMHNFKDPDFGGLNPEPNEKNLKELIRRLKTNKFHAGLATDGDADRFGIVDAGGAYINANNVISILLIHLLKNKQMRGPVARSVATTHLVDKIAKHYNIKVIETPVGFKYIGEALREKGVILGGEESGGLSILGHIPEKDGILAVSLMAEVRAAEKISYKKILQNIMKQFGAVYNKRIDLHITEKQKQNFFYYLSNFKQKEFLGLKIKNVNTIDGYKIIFEEGSWVLFRPSGTEPIVRVYIETSSRKKFKMLSAEAEKLITKQ